jgi:hypothetical protein
LENRRAEQVLSGKGWYQWEGEKVEKGYEGEYSANAVYICIINDK